VGSKSDIVAGLDILKYTDNGTGTGSLSKKTTTTVTSGTAWYILPDFITAGNFNGNEQGKEQLNLMKVDFDISNNVFTQTISTNTYPYCSMRFYHYITSVSGSTLTQTSLNNTISPQMLTTFHVALTSSPYYPYVKSTDVENGSMPFVASARSAEGAKTLKYLDHQTTMSEPRIYALLAAPPFHKYKPDGTEYEYPGATSMGTAWGSNDTKGSGNSRKSSNKAEVILGYEHEITFPITGTKLGGVEFEAKLGFEWESSTEKTYTESQSIDWVAPQNDAVILSATFFDTYIYEIISSDNSDEIGGKLLISFPESEPRTMALNLEDYKMLMEDCPTAPRLDKLFTHKVGFPLTYPRDKSQIVSNVPPDESDPDNTIPSTVLWATNDGYPEFIDVGSGNDVTRSIALNVETEKSTGFNFNLEAQLVLTVATAKIGAGYGHGESWGTSHSEGSGHAVAGTVPSPARLGDVKNFRWTLCWYKYNLDGQTFPVVYYVVKE
jgi:hypothetical protein